MDSGKIQIEYNQNLVPLVTLLSQVNRKGDFFAQGEMEIPLPRIEVAGVGTISFPVLTSQAVSLIAQATKAPYGRGQETILDESVRKVWQVPADQVKIGGRSWGQHFSAILTRVLSGLGCEGLAVTAELYKLLIYEAGGFFLPHRDSEKQPGMFATLVLVLPSEHSGGELIIRHGGREATVDLSGREVSELGFVAFYADCEHEVRPLRVGYRICLVYNLLQQRPNAGNEPTVQAPDYGSQISAASSLLQAEWEQARPPAKLVYLLEHQYSPEGLGFAGLKGADAARVEVLVRAAERVGGVAHLGIVHIEEMGAAEPPSEFYSRSRRDRYSEVSATASTREFEVIEVSERRHFVDQWRDSQDQPVAFGEIPIVPDELFPAGALDHEKPDEQRLMEASGNEGATFERSYHRAVLVLWLKGNFADVLLQSGVEAALPLLSQQIGELRAGTNSAVSESRVIALARRVVEAWRVAPEFPRYRQPGRPKRRAAMLESLIGLGDRGLLEEFVRDLVVFSYDGSENGALVGAARLLGPKRAIPLLVELLSERLPFCPRECVQLLGALMSLPITAQRDAWLAARGAFARAAVQGLEEIGSGVNVGGGHFFSEKPDRCEVVAAALAELLNVLIESAPPTTPARCESDRCPAGDF